MKNLITCLVVCVLSGAAFAETWTVDDDGKADFDNIQAAVDAASDGDEIVVMPGTYTSTQDGHVVNMHGKAVWLHSSEGQEVTIIDGEGARRGMYCVSVTDKTVIEGFTITNGYANQGGGMCSFASNPTLIDCTFTNNIAEYKGGGMYNEYDSSPALTNCTFENNTTTSLGGGMYNEWLSSPTLTNCTFTNNTADYGGGGMYNHVACYPTLTHTIVCGNTPDQIYGDWTDGCGSCIAYSCEDNNGDGIPDKCTNPGSNTILVPEEYATIQDAINVAVHGDEIIIGPGTYTGGGNWVVNPMGKRLWIHSSDGPEVTIIDGEGVRRGIQCTGGETGETIFEGLTITNGYAEYKGGGMYNYYSSPTLTNCTFTDNTAKYGGGMYNYYSNSNSDPTLNGCTFENNVVIGSGGGMYNYSCSPMLTGCIFTDNTADRDGGGMNNDTYGNPTLTNCTFTNNTATLDGGGMNNETFSSPTLTNCTFTNNSATLDGGGMYNYGTPMLTNCTFTGNTAGSGGGMNNSNFSPTLTDTTVCGNTPDQIYGGWTDDGGNMVADTCSGGSTGACCVGTSCSIETATDCSTAGGTYLGDGSSCKGDPCGGGSNVWTVDDNGKADFDNIQAAVDAASYGDEIVVMPGTYTSTAGEVVNMEGKQIWLHSNKGAKVTIIDGKGARRGIACVNGETSNTIIEGFTITNGYAYNGGGMWNDNSSPTLTNCTFTGNTADYGGGGMYNINSSNPTLTDCTFENNTANNRGGGMYNNSSSNPTLENCIFENNTAYYGGGMWNDNCCPTLTNCTFENNTANNRGGGMYNNGGSSPTLTNCTFENNTSTYDGGGMYNYYDSNPTLTDCTFENNTAAGSGGGMYNYVDCSPTLTDTTVCGNTPNQIIGDWTDNGGNWVEDECPIDCPDINGDGIVNVSDLLAIIDQWGLTNSPADVNDDGIVDVSDLLIVVGNWGACP